MRLAHPSLQHCIDFKENRINVLTVENSNLFRTFVLELISQTEGEYGSFVLSENNKELELSKKAVVIENPLCISVNSRKIQPKLNAIAEQTAYENEILLHKVFESLNTLGSEITSGMDFNAMFTEVESADLLVKLLNIRIDDESLNYSEKIFEFMKLHRELIGTDLFVYINLKTFMSNDEIRLFYREIFYNKYNVLLIESSRKPGIIAEENDYIIDESLCEIY